MRRGDATLEKNRCLVAAVWLLGAISCTVHAQSAQETKLEVTDVQFEPLQQGKNVVRVEVRNASNEDQVFRTHIFTRSPEYGRGGVGWGTGFFDTIPAGKTVWTRFAFKIQGPMTKSTLIRLTLSNPGPQEGFSEEAWAKSEGPNQWFKRTEYQARNLTWARTDSSEDQPALFTEGFAVYMSQRLGVHALEDLSGGQATIDERARELKAKGDWIELAELMTYPEIGSARSRPAVAYAQAASFVKFLIDTYGKDKFLQAYTTLKNSDNKDTHAQNATSLAAIYGRSPQELRDAWEATLVQETTRR